MLEYLKASPGTKLDEIEKAMRTQGMNYWIYALVRESPPITVNQHLKHLNRSVSLLTTKLLLDLRASSIANTFGP